MIEEVRIGQHQLKALGFYVDERGIAIASKVAIIFHDISRVIAFFRSYSQKNTLEHINSEMRLFQSRSENGLLEMLLLFNLDESHAIDQISQIAKHHRARTFIGHEQIFLPYRDRNAPLGYDLLEAIDITSDHDNTYAVEQQLPVFKTISLFLKTGRDQRQNGREISITQLFKRLSLIPQKVSEFGEQPVDVIFRVEIALLSPIMRYLFKRQVDATIRRAFIEETFVAKHRNLEISLFECVQVPAFILRSLSQTPGITIFKKVDDGLLVQWGYQHPIALESCSGFFDQKTWHLFYSNSAKNESVTIEEQALDISDFISVNIDKQAIKTLKNDQIERTPIEYFQVPLKFAQFLYSKSKTPQAILIPLDRLDWLHKLLYLLPATLIHNYHACIVNSQLILLSHEGLEGIPFGIPLREAYSSIFFPFDMELLPRIEERFLRQAFSLNEEQKYYFFIPKKNSPNSLSKQQTIEIEHLLALSHHDFKALSHSVLSKENTKYQLENLDIETELEALADTFVIHEKIRPFSLWGKNE